MSYLHSNKVVVFPSTERANTNPANYTYARMTSEGNLTNLISSLISPYEDANIKNDGFIISAPNDTGLGEIEFIINGYYFWVDLGNNNYTPSNNDTKIWASIELSNFGELSDYPELSGSDIEGYFKGISFNPNAKTTPSVVGNTCFNLLLYVKENNIWKVCEKSYIRTKAHQIDFSDVTKIDGKF